MKLGNADEFLGKLWACHYSLVGALKIVNFGYCFLQMDM